MMAVREIGFAFLAKLRLSCLSVSVFTSPQRHKTPLPVPPAESGPARNALLKSPLRTAESRIAGAHAHRQTGEPRLCETGEANLPYFRQSSDFDGRGAGRDGMAQRFCDEAVAGAAVTLRQYDRHSCLSVSVHACSSILSPPPSPDRQTENFAECFLPPRRIHGIHEVISST
ncbi:hypothetical protein [Prosthecobacter sp.]|uniref:hypothetical protein n=1 Tax=Prosthecobacter sp. TaxID=1965333 RepID=UPI002487F980|nr:hypothetical protein [Prosthecobacter sp.]MDI1311158.1 hypothetical protein [Prosthecobacter sp.]